MKCFKFLRLFQQIFCVYAHLAVKLCFPQAFFWSLSVKKKKVYLHVFKKNKTKVLTGDIVLHLTFRYYFIEEAWTVLFCKSSSISCTIIPTVTTVTGVGAVRKIHENKYIHHYPHHGC